MIRLIAVILVVVIGPTIGERAMAEPLNLGSLLRQIDDMGHLKNLKESFEVSAMRSAESSLNRTGPLTLEFEGEFADDERRIRSVVSETFRFGVSTSRLQRLAEANANEEYLGAQQTFRSIKRVAAEAYLNLRLAQMRFQIATKILGDAQSIFSKASSASSSGTVEPLADLKWSIIKQHLAAEVEMAKQVFAANAAVLRQINKSIKVPSINEAILAPVTLDLPSKKAAQYIDLEIAKLRANALDLEAANERSMFEFSAGGGIEQSSVVDQPAYIIELAIPIGSQFVQRQRSASLLARKHAEERRQDLLRKNLSIGFGKDLRDVNQLAKQWSLKKDLYEKIEDLMQRTLRGFNQGLASANEYIETLESGHDSFLDMIGAEQEHSEKLIDVYFKYAKVQKL